MTDSPPDVDPQHLTSAFPDGSKVLHIGPPKTGTSSLQGGLHVSRDRLSAHGVSYAGQTRHARAAATYAALGRRPEDVGPGAPAAWQRLSSEVRGSSARIVLCSSEAFAMADSAAARRVVDDLGGEVQVVLTLRPMAAMLASAWQQRIRNQRAEQYDAWLAQMFAPAPHAGPAAWYWEHYGADNLVRRWGEVVGAQNITVVVLDPADRGFLLRAFDALLGIPEGTLVPDTATANESLPFPAIEMLRHFNLAFDESGGQRREWVQAVRRRTLKRIRESEEPVFAPAGIDVPRWAAEAANEVSLGWISSIDASGVRVVGDLQHLVVDASRHPETVEIPDEISTKDAAALALLLYEGAREHFSRSAATPTQHLDGDAGVEEDADEAVAERRTLMQRLAAAVRALRG